MDLVSTYRIVNYALGVSQAKLFNTPVHAQNIIIFTENVFTVKNHHDYSINELVSDVTMSNTASKFLF